MDEWISLRDRIRAITDRHLASLDAFHVDGEAEGYPLPRSLSSLNRDFVSLCGFSRHEEDALYTGGWMLDQARTITTSAITRSLLRNRRVRFSKLISDEFICMLWHRYHTGMLGPRGLSEDNPYSAAVFVELLVRLHELLTEQSPDRGDAHQKHHHPRFEMPGSSHSARYAAATLLTEAILSERANWLHALRASIANESELTGSQKVRDDIAAFLRVSHRHRLCLTMVISALDAHSQDPSTIGTETIDLLADDPERCGAMECASAEDRREDVDRTLNDQMETLEVLRAKCRQVSEYDALAVPVDGITTTDIMSMLTEWMIDALSTSLLAVDGVLPSITVQHADRIDKVFAFQGHGYLNYWYFLALSRLEEYSSQLAPWTDEDGETRKRINRSRDTVSECVLSRLHEQVALAASGSEDADPLDLGFQLATSMRFFPRKVGREMVALALNQIFERQATTGLWPRGHAAWVSPSSGEFHCNPFELISALVLAVRAEDSQGELTLYWQNIERVVDWLERNSRPLRFARPGAATSTTAGWSLGHRFGVTGVDDRQSMRTRPNAWTTAESYTMLHLLDRWISRQLNRAVFDGLGKPPARVEAVRYPLSRMKTPVKIAGGQYPVGDLFQERIEQPLKMTMTDDYVYSIASWADKSGLIRSGVLFGPPGTRKTSLVTSLAAELRWPLLALDPADFADKGTELLPGRVTEVFRLLSQLEDVVVFFDEMEELLRERTDSASAEQRMWTAIMLPRLQELHDAGCALFVVATNHVNRVDPAILRPGRFDFVLGVPVMDGTNKFRYERPNPGREQLLLAEVLRGLEAFYFESERGAPENAFRLRKMNEAAQETTANFHSWIDAFAPKEFQSFIEQVEISYRTTSNKIPIDDKVLRQVAHEVAEHFLPSRYDLDDSVNRFEGIQ